MLAVLAASIFSQNVFAQTEDLWYHWHRVLTGNSNQTVHGIIKLDSGGFLVSGRLDVSVDFDPGAGVESVNDERYLVKYTENGGLVWVRGLPLEINYAPIAVDNSGNIHMAGAFGSDIDFDPGLGVFELSADTGDRDVFYVKLNASGEFLTAFDIDGGSDIGPYPRFNPEHIQVDAAGSVYLVGRLLGSIDIDPGAGVTTLTPVGDYDIGIAKFNAAGVFQWGASLGDTEEEYTSVCTVADGGTLYCAGAASIDEFTSVGDLYVFAMDTTGNLMWDYTVGTPGNETPLAVDIALDSNGDVVITGTFTGTFDFDPGIGVTQLTSLPHTTPADNSDAFVLKLDGASGSLAWGKQFGSTQNEVAHALHVTSNGEILLNGTFVLHTDLDPGPASASMVTPSGYTDTVGFVSALDSAGDFLWAKRVGEMWLTTAVVIEEDGGVIFGGQWTGTRDVVPGFVEGIHTASVYDAYIVRMQNLTSVPGASEKGLALSIGLIVIAALWLLRHRKAV